VLVAHAHKTAVKPFCSSKPVEHLFGRMIASTLHVEEIASCQSLAMPAAGKSTTGSPG
jgi:hypothetical protein